MQFWVLISSFCLLTSVTSVTQSGFNPKDIVQQTRSVPRLLDPLNRGLDGSEFLIDTSISYIPALGYQSSPSVAFDGTNFLIVWEDHRNVDDFDIYGARVTQAGIILDPDGFPISTAVNDQEFPAVAFDGTNFLVVWHDWRTDMADIYGTRVTSQGVVLDTNGIPISATADRQEEPAITFDGTNFLVVWQDRRSRGFIDIYGARVTQAGVVLDPNGFPISTVANNQESPAIVFDGTNFFIVWEDDRNLDNFDIYGARVTQAGTVLDPNGFVISTAANDQKYPAVSFDSTNFLLVWQDFRIGGDYSHIYGARVTQSGVVLDPNGISISMVDFDQWFPAVAFDGTNFLVVWEEWRNSLLYYDIYGTRVTQTGVVLDPNSIAISPAEDAQYAPAVVFDGTNLLVTWQDCRCGIDIYGARVTQAGVVLDPDGFLISTAANNQESPALAFDGTNFIVVWEDWRSGWELNIYGARVTQAGTVLDPNGFPISTAANYQESPAVAFDGTNFLIVWKDRRNPDDFDIYGARVTQVGTVLDPNGFAISTVSGDQELPAVAFDGTNFLVTWQDNRNGFDWDIYGALVTPQGTVLDSLGIAISTAANHQRFHDLAFDGLNYLVVWTDNRNGLSDIYGARVTPQGTVLESLGIAISTGATSQWYPAIAFDDTNFLVVWQDWRGGSADIYGARVTSAGMVLDPIGIPISTAVNTQSYPANAFDGSNFLVVWEDDRNGPAYDIYGAHVTSGGIVLETFPVVRQEGNQVFPALAHGTGNQIFLVYQGWAGTVGAMTYNTDRIWGKMNPSPGIEEAEQPITNRQKAMTTIVRGILNLQSEIYNLKSEIFLLDIAGRKVADLKSGANDIHHFSPGVYFVRQKDNNQTFKVVITR